jgi:biopolymer transport protein ExbD
MSNSKSSSENEVELNITPIIDCFTVLITFLLASASFISVGFFAASTSGPGESSETQKPDIDAMIYIGKNGSIELKWNGKKNGSIRFNEWNETNSKQITETLTKLKSEPLLINQIMVSASNDTEYGNLANILGAVDQSGLPVVVGDFQ